MSNLGSVSCPLCGNQHEVKTKSSGSLSGHCPKCGLQWFNRSPAGVAAFVAKRAPVQLPAQTKNQPAAPAPKKGSGLLL